MRVARFMDKRIDERDGVTTLPARITPDITRDLIKQIAMDIGKETVAYIDVMYPEAPAACSSTFRLSLRNTIYNEIMAALDVTDEGEITARLARRKKWRREWKAMWKKNREKRAVP